MIPIVGARTPKQLEDSLGGFDFVIQEAEMSLLDEISAIDLCFPMIF
ncbi:MAG: hypothetical protein J0L94_05665 [Rhodothermia bacterium]|nr:hypothetical protein [Rhodothermia bacterium]